jgi:hypothetical protein
MWAMCPGCADDARLCRSSLTLASVLDAFVCAWAATQVGDGSRKHKSRGRGVDETS